MKTKIIYISGNEIFDMADIRAAFEEVRSALNLDKNTVLFGVPIDEDDAGLATSSPEQNSEPIEEPIAQLVENNDIETVTISESTINENIENNSEKIEKSNVQETKTPEKKSGRTRKSTKTDSGSQENDDKIVPILSVLSTNESNTDTTNIDEDEQTESNDEIQIIEDVTHETEMSDDTNIDSDIAEPDSKESDLEQLLSEMKPLQEDILDEPETTIADSEPEEEPENIDATLEKLATEFVQTQDKIANTKSASRSRIGKLRNILPFKQSKHHDQGLGDLFGWAGVAANDEDFSVPGFFTTTSSKK